MVIKACAHILNSFYGQNIQFKEPIIFSAWDDEGHISKHYTAEMDLRFVEVKKIRPLKNLSHGEIQNLLSNVYDVDLWLHHLPPENFEFHGMVVGNLIDITEQESLSRLKHVLLSKDAVVYRESVSEMEGYLQTYFGNKSLRLGITAIDYPMEYAVSHGYRIRHDFLSNRVEKLLAPSYRGSIYEQVCQLGQTLTFESLPEVE